MSSAAVTSADLDWIVAAVRFVRPTRELERARFARAADLELDESWAARPSW